MKKTIITFIVFFFFLVAFNTVQHLGQTVPKNWPAPTYDFEKNPLLPEKILLGKVLFYDPLLSRNNTISCANCHSPFTAFTHTDHALSHGIEDRIGTRNTPALMNLAWQKNFMWDGSVERLDLQALHPIANANEMDEKLENVLSKLQKSPIYPGLFYKAFGDSAITSERMLTSISQFELTLISSNSKYDSVMRHQSVFSNPEKNGYALFKKHCASCHTEPLFTNNGFENNGLSQDISLMDAGRMISTKNTDDSLKFKVPTLRNIELSYPYMHDGRFNRLSEVMRHYTSGIQQSKTLSKKLSAPILLSSNDKVDIISFLLTLTDRDFLLNPDFAFPKDILLQKHASIPNSPSNQQTK